MNKKGLLFVVFAVFTAFAVFAAPDSFKVESITGKVQYEATPGTWKDVKVGQELSSSTVVNTSLNSSMVIASGKTKTTIKAMQKGTVASLTQVASSGIKKGANVAKSAVGDIAKGAEKGVATASSRASEAKEDIDWDEE